jgi:hypothetical protein
MSPNTMGLHGLLHGELRGITYAYWLNLVYVPTVRRRIEHSVMAGNCREIYLKWKLFGFEFGW